jgi:hypothetical protein
LPCVISSLSLARNVKTGTTPQRRTSERLLINWRLRNIAPSAGVIRFTKKPSRVS